MTNPVQIPDAAVQTVIDTYIDKVKHMAERSYEFDTPDQNGAWPDHQDAMVTVGELRALRRILPLISDATLTNGGTKPVDVAAVRETGFREGLEVAAKWHEEHAIGYETEHSNLNIADELAAEHRGSATAIRALSAEPAARAALAQGGGD